MENLFRPDGKVVSFLDKATNLVVLNIIWLICCLPIFTVGASTTALYSVTMKMIRNEEGRILRDFFKSFKSNFKQATIITLLFIVIGLFFVLDSWILSFFDIAGEKIIIYIIYVVIMFAMLVFSYAFPILAYFDDKIQVILQNAMLMSLKHYGYSVIILIMNACPLLFYVTFGEVTHFAIYIWIVIGVSLIAYINSYFFLKIFKNYTSDKEMNHSATKERKEHSSNLLN